MVWFPSWRLLEYTKYTAAMFRKAFLAGSDQKIKLLEEKLMYKTYWAIFANFTGILLK